jgi:hypothetical protein
MDRQHITELIEEKALVQDSMDFTRIMKIREEMERAEARKLQPHFISSFFLEAFRLLGGSIREREPKRYEITHVPAVIRNRDRMIGTGEAVLSKYERSASRRPHKRPGKAVAACLSGHPLLTPPSIWSLRGTGSFSGGSGFNRPPRTSAIAPDPLYLEHSIRDRGPPHRVNAESSQRGCCCRDRLLGEACNVGYAPYLEYMPLDRAIEN